MKKSVKTMAPLLLAVILSACVGGGGGGGGGSATISTFTKFSAMTPEVATRMTGSSQEGTYTWNSTTNKVTSVGAVSAFGGTATADVTLDASNVTKAISFTSASGATASWSTAAGDRFGILTADTGVGAVINAAGDKYTLIARASVLGWDYQTFGVWVTGAGTGSGMAGSYSLGAATPGTAIPTTGTATYTGVAGGFYVDPTGTQYFTSAGMSALTNFANRTLAFTTTGTQQSTTLATGSFSANNNLNLSGTLSYAANTNQISGNIASVGGGTANAAMAGTATANFYGPTAQEIGGGFAVKGTGTNVYMGAFGGKR